MNQIKVKDRGANKLLAKLAKGKRPTTLKVGVFGSSADASHDGVSVGELAAIHELGMGVPKRSFVADWADAQRIRIQKELQTASARALEGSLTAELGKLGVKYVGEIQARIAAGIEPPLAESTIARKGSATPLIDTGQLRSSVDWEVK